MSQLEAPCVTCGRVYEGRFCPACGEKRLEPEDLSWRHFWSHTFEAFFHADGRVLRSVKTLILAPGLLTADYLRGKRKPYLAPLSLFLVINLVYFLVQPLSHWDTLVTPLRSHLSGQLYSSWIQPRVTARLERNHESLESYAERFDHHVTLEAHALTIALVPLFFVPAAIVLYWRQRRLLDHLVFSLHFCGFLLIWLFAAQIGFNLVVGALVKWGHVVFTSATLDALISILTLLGCALYLAKCIHRLFGGRRGAIFFQATFLAISLVPVFHAYRLILFFVAYARTSG